MAGFRSIPADVRKAIHDERLSNNDAKLVVLRKLLFGFWEMNWIAFNSAQDVSLRGQRARPALPGPAAGGGRREPFRQPDTQRFSYTVNASRVEG
jgi:hypothetical protein